MIKQECIGIPDMILLLMEDIAEIVVCPGGSYFNILACSFPRLRAQNVP